MTSSNKKQFESWMLKLISQLLSLIFSNDIIGQKMAAEAAVGFVTVRRETVEMLAMKMNVWELICLFFCFFWVRFESGFA